MDITTIRQIKGRKVLFMKDYRYRVDRETKNGAIHCISWCMKKVCKLRLKTDADMTMVLSPSTGNIHDKESDYNRQHEHHVREEVKYLRSNGVMVMG